MSVLSYDSVQIAGPAVLEDFTLAIGPAETVVIAGGVGKFALMKVALGMGSLQSGAVRTFAMDPFALGPSEVARLRARCALVPHTGALISNLSVRANTALPLEYHRQLSSAQIATRVDAALEELELSPLSELRPALLTYQEQRLVGIARARAIGPELLLLQDPYEGLEASVQRGVQAVLSAMASAGCATLIATAVTDLGTTYEGRLAPTGTRRVVQRAGGVAWAR